MPFKSIILSAVLLFSTGIAFAQPAAPANAGDKLSYELSAGRSSGQHYSLTFEERPGMYVSKGASNSLHFDPNSFAVAAVPGSTYDMNLKVEKEGVGFESGKEWKISFTLPSRGGACTNNMLVNYKVVSQGEQSMKVTVDGKEAEIKVITTTQSGSWSHPGCASGTSTGTVIYSPSLKAVILSDWTSYYNGNVVSKSRVAYKDIAERVGEKK